MGRITPSFCRVFHSTVFQLKKVKGFYHSLKDPGHQAAFHGIVKAMSSEYAAMWNSGIYCVEDIMNLLANVHVRKCIDELEHKLDELEVVLKKEYLDLVSRET